jgi:hypothetical protein
MGLHKLTAGSGYDYLTRQVADTSLILQPGLDLIEGALSIQTACLRLPRGADACLVRVRPAPARLSAPGERGNAQPGDHDNRSGSGVMILEPPAVTGGPLNEQSSADRRTRHPRLTDSKCSRSFA